MADKKIHELKTADARALVKRTPTDGELCLSGFTSMTTTAAKELIQWKGRTMRLDSLQALPPDIATELARWRGDGESINPSAAPGTWESEQTLSYLTLNGVKTLTEESAAVLSSWVGFYIELDGLQTLNDAAAQRLVAMHVDQVSLNGLTTIEEETAARLLSWGLAALSLEGLRSISIPKKAPPCGVYQLTIGLEALSAPFIHTLIDSRCGQLHLPSIKTLEAEALKALSLWSGDLLLGLESLSEESAKGLSKCKHINSLSFPRLTSLSTKSAKGLTKWPGSLLSLDGLKKLSPELTKLLLSMTLLEELSLKGLEELSAAVKEMLQASEKGIHAPYRMLH